MECPSTGKPGAPEEQRAGLEAGVTSASIPGVYGGLLDKVPMRAAFAKG